MKKIRFYCAMFAAKLSLAALKLLGRNASYLPGKIALAIDKDFIGGLTPPKTVIAVTGTNGKTTVSNLLNSILLETAIASQTTALAQTFRRVLQMRFWRIQPFLGKLKKRSPFWKWMNAAPFVSIPISSPTI